MERKIVKSRIFIFTILKLLPSSFVFGPLIQTNELRKIYIIYGLVSNCLRGSRKYFEKKNSIISAILLLSTLLKDVLRNE